MTALVIELTELLKQGGGIISKRITLGEDGRPKSDGSACRLSGWDSTPQAHEWRRSSGSLARFSQWHDEPDGAGSRPDEGWHR